MEGSDWPLTASFGSRSSGNSDSSSGCGDSNGAIRQSMSASAMIARSFASGVARLLTTDALVEGVHFRWSWDRPAGLAAAAFLVNASDIAAMGGTPRFALLSLAAPRSARASDLGALVRGFAAAARRTPVSSSADLSASRRWVLSATARRRAVRRTTPSIGCARRRRTLGERQSRRRSVRARDLARTPARPCRANTRVSPAAGRLELGRALARSRAASAAIDVSDGLVSDLGHVCRASGVGAIVEVSCLPYSSALRRLGDTERARLALAGGEDYELLFTIPSGRSGALARLRRLAPITPIGRIVRGSGVRSSDERHRAYRRLRSFQGTELNR